MSTYDDIKNKIDIIHNITYPFNEAITQLNRFLNDKKYYENISFIKKVAIINILLKDIISEIDEPLDNLYSQIRKLRENCSHDWVYIGSGHCDDYYKCSKCGKEDKW